MVLHTVRTIRPDTKGRICLGKLAQGISGFNVNVDKHHRIILEPLVEIPAAEKWLFDNEVALKKVKQGLKELGEGKLVSMGSFAKYVDTDEDGEND